MERANFYARNLAGDLVVTTVQSESIAGLLACLSLHQEYCASNFDQQVKLPILAVLLGGNDK
jgi:hypothetical protein